MFQKFVLGDAISKKFMAEGILSADLFLRATFSLFLTLNKVEVIFFGDQFFQFDFSGPNKSEDLLCVIKFFKATGASEKTTGDQHSLGTTE